MPKSIPVLLLILLAILFSRSAESSELLVLPDQENIVLQAGDPVSVERVGGYPKILVKLIVWWNGMSKKLPVGNGVTLYRVNYLTTGEKGGLVEVSGLLSVPNGVRAKSVISWQHGTALKHQDAPSAPSPDEGVLVSIAFAGNSNILLAPDYIGLGISRLPHPYYFLPTTVGSTRDLISASRVILKASNIDYPNRLFLAGFSQGGHNTMATTRDLEQDPLTDLTLVASASIAGPIDLDGFAFSNVLRGESKSSSMYITYMLGSFARIYSHDLTEVFKPVYATLIPNLFNGELNSSDIARSLPRDPKLLFNEDYLQAHEQGNLGWPGRRMAENDLDAWMPKTPLRLYYGTSDVDVSHTEAVNRAKIWQQAGANVQAINVGHLDHNESAVESALRIQKWFASFE